MMNRFLAALCMAAFISGCATPSYRQASITNSRIDDTSRSLTRAARSIDDAIIALTSLQGKTGVDLRNQYVIFIRRVNELEKQQRRVTDKQNRLEANSRSYFASWERELRRFRSAELKKKSRQRRQIAIDNFNRVFDALQVEDEAYRMIIYDLTDIRRYLGYDLSPESVASISENIGRASQDAVSVRRKIDQAIRDLEGTPTPLPADTSPVPGGEKNQ